MKMKVEAMITLSLNKAEQVMFRALANEAGTAASRLQELGCLALSYEAVNCVCSAQ